MIGIGNGTAAQARKFQNDFAIEFELYTDPTLASFRAFNLKRKLGIGPTAIFRYLKVLASGHRQSWTHGDALQQGGVVLIDEPGDVVWSHVNDGPGDHANLETVLTQTRALTSGN